jgi:hypothetical protein
MRSAWAIPTRSHRPIHDIHARSVALTWRGGEAAITTIDADPSGREFEKAASLASRASQVPGGARSRSASRKVPAPRLRWPRADDADTSRNPGRPDRSWLTSPARVGDKTPSLCTSLKALCPHGPQGLQTRGRRLSEGFVRGADGVNALLLSAAPSEGRRLAHDLSRQFP